MSLLFGLLLLAQTPTLQEAAALYERGEHAASLSMLSRLERTVTARRDRARVHLYVGLIQGELGRNQDAERSLEAAFRLDRTLRLPRGASDHVRRLFFRVRERFPRRRKADPPPPPQKVETSTIAVVEPFQPEPLPEVKEAPLRTSGSSGPSVLPEWVEPPPHPATIVSASVGGAATGAAVTFAVLSEVAASAARGSASADEARRQNDRARTYRTVALVSVVSAVVAVGTALGIHALD